MHLPSTTLPLALLCLGLAVQQRADADEPTDSLQVRPYEAVYQITEGGRKAKLKVQLRSLTSDEDPADTFWVFNGTASIFIWKLHLEVRFRRVGLYFQPLHTTSRFGKRKQTYEVDWEGGELTYTDRHGSQQMIALTPQVRDNITMQWEAAAELAALEDRTGWSRRWKLLDGRKARSWKEVQLKWDGTEQVELESGSFDCVRLRVEKDGGQLDSTIWLSPAANWVLVRQQQHGAEGRDWELLSLQLDPAG